MNEDEEKRLDFLGDELCKGDLVIVAHGRGELEICKIENFKEKMVIIKPLKRKNGYGFLRYSTQLIKMEKEKAVEYILKI